MMKHQEMIDDIAARCQSAGYQTLTNFEYKTRKLQGEIDVLVIDMEHKLLGIVEVKTYFKRKNYLKATDQLNKDEKAAKKYLGFRLYDICKVYYSNTLKRVVS